MKKNEAIKFKIADSIHRLMHQWLMTLQDVYTEYHKQILSADNSEERNMAIGNMLFMIDFIDAPEQTITPNLKDEAAKDALKGMLASARMLKHHIRTEVELQNKQTDQSLEELSQRVKEEITEIL